MDRPNPPRGGFCVPAETQPERLEIPGPAGTLHARDWGGPGRPLILLHGLGANTHWWDLCAPLLEGFRPIALDFRGHGESAWAEGDGVYEPDGYADDVEALRAALGLKAFDVAAHSLGARVALVYAARRPAGLGRLAALDFLCEINARESDRFTRAQSVPQPYYERKELVTARFRLHPSGTTLPAQELAALAEHGVKKADKGWTWRFDWRAFRLRFVPVWPVLARVAAPALLVRGEHSGVMPRPHLERCARELAGSRAAEIPGAYHHVTLDAPEETARLIAAHLRENT